MALHLPRHRTDTAHGQHARLDARHRSHARVEDRISCGKDTGPGRLPSKLFTINQAWLACAMIAIDLIAWTQTILLHDDPALARAEPNALRYGLHVAACLTRSGRRVHLRLDPNWPSAATVADAVTTLRAIPDPT